jgi:hypothetical protein
MLSQLQPGFDLSNIYLSPDQWEQIMRHLASDNHGPFGYIPSIEANTIYMVIFVILFLGTIVQHSRARQWDILATMVPGIILEIVGYTARLRMHCDPYARDMVIMYVCDISF